MQRKIVFFLTVLLTVFSGMLVPGAKADGTAGDYFYDLGAQLGRGFENVLTSPAEIPCTMKTESKDKGGMGYLTGFGKGTLFMLRRMLVGVCEIGTFVIPAPRTLPPVCQEQKAAVV